MSKLKSMLSQYLLALGSDKLIASSTKRVYASLARQFVYFVEETGFLSTDFTEDALMRLAQKFLTADLNGKASLINSRASATRHFLNTVGIPCRMLVRPETGRTTCKPLNDEELSTFLTAADKFRPRDRAIALLLATTGIRLNECAALDLENVRQIENTPHLIIDGAGAPRQIPLTPATVVALQDYLESRVSESSEKIFPNPLFTDKNGNRLSLRAQAACIRKIGWSVRMCVTPSILRLTRLMHIARAGDDIVTLAYLGGYDSLESAKRILRACETDNWSFPELLACHLLEQGRKIIPSR